MRTYKKPFKFPCTRNRWIAEFGPAVDERNQITEEAYNHWRQQLHAECRYRRQQHDGVTGHQDETTATSQ